MIMVDADTCWNLGTFWMRLLDQPQKPWELKLFLGNNCQNLNNPLRERSSIHMSLLRSLESQLILLGFGSLFFLLFSDEESQNNLAHFSHYYIPSEKDAHHPRQWFWSCLERTFWISPHTPRARLSPPDCDGFWFQARWFYCLQHLPGEYLGDRISGDSTVWFTSQDDSPSIPFCSGVIWINKNK